MRSFRSRATDLTAGAIVALTLSSVVVAQQAGPGVMPGYHAFNGGTILQAASEYHNWGTLTGTTGYGIRDNAGQMQFKDSGGAWTSFVAGATANNWTRTGTMISPTTAGDDVSTTGRFYGGSTALVVSVQNRFTGSFTSSTTSVFGTYFDPTLTPTGAASGSSGLYVKPTVALTAAAQTVYGTRADAPAITLAAGAVDNATTHYIQAAPTISGGGTITQKYALWVDGDDTRLDGNLIIGGAQIFGATALTTQQRTRFTGSFTSTASDVFGLTIDGALTPVSGSNAYGINNALTYSLPAAAALVIGTNLGPPAITLAAGAVTTAATLRVNGAPTISGGGTITNAYALQVSSGSVEFTGAGPHAIGAAMANSIGLRVSTNGTAAGAGAHTVQFGGTVTASANNDTLAGINLGPVTYAKGAFTGGAAMGVRLVGSDMAATGAGTLATATALYIADAPTIGTTNRAIWVDGGDVRFDGTLAVSGQTAFGQTTMNASVRNWFGGSFTSTAAGYATYITGDITPASGNNAYGLSLAPSFTLPAAANQVFTFEVAVANSVLAAGAITNAASAYIAGAPTVSGGGTITNAYALWVDAGASRFDGVVQWGQSNAEPACSATTRGTVVMVQGGAGVADTFRICSKDAADAYAYRALY